MGLAISMLRPGPGRQRKNPRYDPRRGRCSGGRARNRTPERRTHESNLRFRPCKGDSRRASCPQSPDGGGGRILRGAGRRSVPPAGTSAGCARCGVRRGLAFAHLHARTVAAAHDAGHRLGALVARRAEPQTAPPRRRRRGQAAEGRQMRRAARQRSGRKARKSARRSGVPRRPSSSFVNLGLGHELERRAFDEGVGRGAPLDRSARRGDRFPS